MASVNRTIPELKDLLRERGLATSGNKSELIQRLYQRAPDLVNPESVEDDAEDDVDNGDQESDDPPNPEEQETRTRSRRANARVRRITRSNYCRRKETCYSAR